MPRYATLAFAFFLASLASGQAASLRVSPILIEGTSNATVTLKNQEARPINAQVRVFRWSQKDGGDELVPTGDVVASPPILSIAPNADYVVRLQHLSASLSAPEESYRVVVDELPNPNRQRNGTIEIVLRYIVPAFFGSPDASQPRLRWTMQERGGRRLIVAENSGDKRIQISNLGFSSGGKTLIVQKGLAGYVLGHSAKAWPLSPKISAGRATSIVAMSDHGAIRASLSP
jgi:fimbrial chaperone protein